MNYMLQEHGAKHVLKIPNGLNELCSDISREVLRSQPENIYSFIADYVDALLITRENAKVATNVVDDITVGSECIVNILQKCGLKMDLVAESISKLQHCFHEFLYTTTNEEPSIEISDRKSQISIRKILEATGTSTDKAEKAAIKIQSVFRGHYERIKIGKIKDEIQVGQHEVTNAIEKSESLKNDEKISKTASSIPPTYCCYSYYQKNPPEGEVKEEKI